MGGAVRPLLEWNTQFSPSGLELGHGPPLNAESRNKCVT
jgi:hypothetical protein